MTSRKPVQLANDEWAPTAAKGPLAQRAQATTTEWDVIALRLARRTHTTIAWWWGHRVQEGKHVGVCYICDQAFIDWWPRHGMSKAQRATVRDHLATHYMQLLDEKSGL